MARQWEGGGPHIQGSLFRPNRGCEGLYWTAPVCPRAGSRWKGPSVSCWEKPALYGQIWPVLAVASPARARANPGCLAEPNCGLCADSNGIPRHCRPLVQCIASALMNHATHWPSATHNASCKCCRALPIGSHPVSSTRPLGNLSPLPRSPGLFLEYSHDWARLGQGAAV